MRCAEPRPVGDNAKAAINRASKRLGFTYSRTKNIWYGGVRRIDAREMDVLRACAVAVDIDQGIVGLEVLRARLCTMPTTGVHKAISGIDAVFDFLGHVTEEVA